jgi:hypothetical protein
MDTKVMRESKINVVGTSAEKLKAHYTKINADFELGLDPLPEDADFKALQTAVGAAQDAMLKKADELDAEAKAKAEADAKKGDEDDDEVAEGDKVYVFVKSPCYVNETERVAGGFYHIDIEKYPRLKTASPVTIYDEMPEMEIADIAKFFGVSTKGKKAAELVETLLSEPSLY